MAQFTKATDPILAKMPDDEAVFVLRGKDALAADVISYWIEQAKLAGVPAAKIVRAQGHLYDFIAWQIEHSDLVRLPGTGG